MTKRGRWPGTWAAICDHCGFRYPSSQLRKDWRGKMVCAEDYETRHPLDFVRGVPDNPAPPWTRPEPAPIMVSYCTQAGASGYADMATAGCARADNNQFTAMFLYDTYLDDYPGLQKPIPPVDIEHGYVFGGYVVGGYFTDEEDESTVSDYVSAGYITADYVV